MTATYGGSWPEIEPFRFVLAGGTELGGSVEDGVITITMPPGDVQRFRLASSLPRESLDLFGPWRTLPPAVRNNADVAEAAADGWLWGLSPFEEVMLVHAVERPLEVPRGIKLSTHRLAGWTNAIITGAVDLHGPSTDSLTLEASWEEPVDDLSLPIWETRSSKAVALRTPVRVEEDVALLGGADMEMNLPTAGRIWMHKAVQEFGDTRNRIVDYRLRASTRFREYFHPELLAGSSPGALDDGESVVSPLSRLSIPSSARPAAPCAASVSSSSPIRISTAIRAATSTA
jgi:hypothetical protein